VLAFDRTTDRLVWEADLPELEWSVVQQTLGLPGCRARNGDSFELDQDCVMILARAGGVRSLPDELSSFALFLDEYATDR
jgi:hypothetical protein